MEPRGRREPYIDYILPSTRVDVIDNDGTEREFEVFVEPEGPYSDKAFAFAPVKDMDDVALFQIQPLDDYSDKTYHLHRLEFGDTNVIRSMVKTCGYLKKDADEKYAVNSQDFSFQDLKRSMTIDNRKYVITYMINVDGPINPYTKYLKRIENQMK